MFQGRWHRICRQYSVDLSHITTLVTGGMQWSSTLDGISLQWPVTRSSEILSECLCKDGSSFSWIVNHDRSQCGWLSFFLRGTKDKQREIWGCHGDEYEDSIRLADVLAKIRTQHLPNISPECYCFASMFSKLNKIYFLHITYFASSLPEIRLNLLRFSGKCNRPATVSCNRIFG